MTTSTIISSSTLTPIYHITPKPLSLSSPKPGPTLTRTHPNPNPYAPIRCQVAVQPNPASPSISDPDDETKTKLDKVGSKVRVKSPMTVYHIPRVPKVEITPDMEGVVKQYVGFWKGKRITATYPFKVEFFTEVEGRGQVKFVAHLKEDELDFLD